MPKYAFILMAMTNADPFLEDVHLALKRVCEKASVTAERVDDIERTGRITDKILDCINRAELIIADLTYKRPNVYYQLGYCHGIGKNVMITAREGTTLHFDIKDFRVIFYRNITQLESKLESALKVLVSQLLVRDYMDRNVSRFSLTGRERGIEYIEKLRRGEEDAYVVVDQQKRELRGVITRSDVHIKKRIYENNPEVEVEGIMTERPYFIPDDDTLEHALRIMASKNIITGLPVVDSRNRVIGYLTRSQVMLALGHEESTYLLGINPSHHV